MKFIVAPDSFKESLTAVQASNAMAKGIKQVFPGSDIRITPIADGGEGTCEVITHALGGEIHYAQVAGPLGAPTSAAFGYVSDSRTAIIEVAEVIGIHLVPEKSRDIWNASSFGMGQLLETVLDHGATRIILGLGGSVTNDGGAGMLSALGLRILDATGNPLPATPLGLRKCASVEFSNFDSRWNNVEITIASDVTSPATGPNGASYIFGKQKGATEADLPILDEAIDRWVNALEDASNLSIDGHPGAGAAGAIATGLLAFFNVSIEPGAELILNLINYADHCDEDCIVFTGEGKIDNQTAFGKGPTRVAKLSKELGAQVFAFGGLVEKTANDLIPEYFDAVIPINRNIGDLANALTTAEENLYEASMMLCHILNANNNR